MMRGPRTLALLMIGASLSVLSSGCAAQTRQRLLAFFFDGAQTPPPTRRLRRDLLQDIEDLQRALAQAKQATAATTIATPAEHASAARPRPRIEQANTWREAAALLPKDASDHVNWTQALREGAIAPQPAVDPQAPLQATFDLDTELSTGKHRENRVTFSHASHTTWLTCQNCHPEPFSLKRQAEPMVITMRTIRQKQFCGVCHGTVAFGVTSCARCHAAGSSVTAWHPSEPPSNVIETVHRWEEAQRILPASSDETPDWTAALVRGVIAPRPAIDPKTAAEPVLAADIVRVPSGAEDYQVVFPHSAHTAWLNCESCHPHPFQMKAGATPMSMDRVNAGELCGVCHGTVAFPVTSCARCHPAMEGGS